MQFYHFDSRSSVDVKIVGAKGASLIHMRRQGFPVPSGFILGTDFFYDWMAEIDAETYWRKLINADGEDRLNLLHQIQTACSVLTLKPEQNALIAEGLCSMTLDPDALLAIRSSAPGEDDLETSFAGIHKSVLGVPPDSVSIERALREVFASLWTEQSMRYRCKQIEVMTSGKAESIGRVVPKMAIILQRQLSSEVAGVAFTLNPLNNCFDELTVNANFGLGESIVSGLVSPDLFVMDKVSCQVLRKNAGSKSILVELNAGGGTRQVPVKDNKAFCLDQEQLRELCHCCRRLEELYQYPLDIEWAFSTGCLYVLQARPITTFIPLPEPLMTGVGEPKKLYLDSTLATQGMNKPVSVLGTDYLKKMTQALARGLFGTSYLINIKNGFVDICYGRMYANVSNLLALPGRQSWIKSFEGLDILSVETLNSNDLTPYTAKRIPKNLLKFIFYAIVHLPLLIMFPVNMLRAMINPEKYHEDIKRKSQSTIESFINSIGPDISPVQLTRASSKVYYDYSLIALPAYTVSVLAKFLLRLHAVKAGVSMFDFEQALPNNVTTEMGLAMFELARFDEIKNCTSDSAFLEQLQKETFSKQFLHQWHVFINTYGFRVPMELDLATPRFYEQPLLLYKRLKLLSDNTQSQTSPKNIFEEGVKKRETALNEVVSKAGPFRSMFIRYYYKVYTKLAAYREIPKYYCVYIIDIMREYFLKLADQWVEQGRLETRNQIFDLRIKDIDIAFHKDVFDLISQAKINSRFYRKLEKVKNFPRLIDSRGKILRPQKTCMKQGELIGHAISPGVAKGPVKVLRTPDEKEILPGDILVTRATDPGWTPLFLNAGGIILEVGGFLQHGAVVAREYNKPCIAGVYDVVNILKDGDIVTMDGASGLINIISK